MDDYFDLGSYSRPISTDSPEAQIWFDRGLLWSYAFGHDEAQRCFEKVIEADPDCAMGYWGVAYASGPYYNQPWEYFSRAAFPKALERTHHFSQQAAARMEGATSAEKTLIHALTRRFQAPTVEDVEDTDAWTDDYAQAMREAHAQFPDDNDVCTLAAEAMMVRTPWLLWDQVKREPAEGTDTAEAIEILETAFARIEAAGEDPHPGLLHMYIHMMEMAPKPERALAASDTLLNLVPDAAHLVHMPSHIYILCGKYQEALDCNVQAVVADAKFFAYDDTLNKYLLYYLHNIHFQVYAALFMGRYDAALRATIEMVDIIPPAALELNDQMIINYLDGFSGMKVHVYVRFGKWQEIIDEPLPENRELFCVTTAMWEYGKGLAYAALGDIKRAEKQKARLAEAVELIPEKRLLFNNTCRGIMQVGIAMLDGELEYRRGNFDEAFMQLRRTVDLYDHLNYTEPWPWMQPPRHALGALLLEQGHVEEATAVYRADLGLDNSLVRPSQHPDNIWSLQGYTECLERSGQDAEAAIYRAKLEVAQAAADVDVSVSCYCRLTAHSCCD